MENKSEHKDGYCELDIARLLLILKTGRYFILASVVIFVLIGVTYIKLVNPVYRYSIYMQIPSGPLKSLTLGSGDAAVYLNPFLVDIDQDKVQAAEKYGIDFSLLKQISGLHISSVNPALLDVTVMAKNKESIQPILQLVLDQLNSWPRFLHQIKDEQAVVGLKTERYSEELDDLYYSYKMLTKSLQNGDVSTLTLSPVDIYADIVNLERELLLLKQIKTRDFDFRYVRPTVLPDAPEKPKKVMIISASLLAGLCCGIFLVFVKNINKMFVSK